MEKSKTEKSKTVRVPRWVLVTLAVLALPVTGLAIWIANSPLTWGTRIADAWRSSYATLVVLVFVIAILAGAVVALYPVLAYNTPRHARKLTVTGVAVAVASFVVLLPVIPGSPARQAYRAGFDALAQYSSSIESSKSSRPAYETRLNAPMAEAILRNSLQDATVWIAENAQPQYSVVDGKPAWCVGLLAKHRVPAASDRVYVTGTSCLVEETMRTIRKDWSVRVPSTQGAYSTNLHKYVARIQRGLSISEADIRFYIENGRPWMLAPVTKLVTDGLTARRVTAGFVTVDPAGTLELHKTARPGEWPVPVVAYSHAEKIRESINTLAGYYCYARLVSPKCAPKNRALEDTSSINGEAAAGDPNAGNATEFVLRRSDGRLVMVTPLTPKGNSRNVVAYLEVLVDALDENEPKAMLYNVTPEASNLQIAQAVTAAYTADVTWTTEVTDGSGLSAASRIFEITPAAPGEVVATIGNATNPEYLLRVTPALDEGSLSFRYCIHAWATNDEIDCRTSTQPAAPIGTLRGVATGSKPVSPGTDAKLPVNLGEMSIDELQKLANAVIAELASR